MNIAKFLASKLQYHCDYVFSVTGGGALFLNEAFDLFFKEKVYYLHNEQACAMAAESNARITQKPAVLCVTTGPGTLNALNGVYGAFTDSIPMIIISGQVKTETTMLSNGLQGKIRQLGDQEVDTRIVEPIVKKLYNLTSADEAIFIIDEAIKLASEGRPGPVWISVPIDIQNAEAKIGCNFNSLCCENSETDSIDNFLEDFSISKRPLMLVGSGAYCQENSDVFNALGEAGMAISPAWTALDLVDFRKNYFAERSGPVGTRAGNVILAAADLVLVVGCKLPIRQISYNFSSFAPNATVWYIDIDAQELIKPFLDGVVDKRVKGDLRKWLGALVHNLKNFTPNENKNCWFDKINEAKKLFPNIDGQKQSLNGLNPYDFFNKLWEGFADNELIVCSDASASVIPFHSVSLVFGQRMFTNAGSASMGYELPAAIGAALGDPNSPVTCIAGDGSIMMNLQELESLVRLVPRVKIILLDNSGYSSIAQSQNRFFGRKFGADKSSGLNFPSFEKLAASFGLSYQLITSMRETNDLVCEYHKLQGALIHVKLPKQYDFLPKLQTIVNQDGTIQSPELKYMGCASLEERNVVDKFLDDLN